MPSLDDFDQVVLDMMVDFGGTATYVKQDAYSFDPVTGLNSILKNEITVKAIMMDISANSGGIGNKSNTLIQEGDKIIYIRPPEKVDSTATPLNIDPSQDKIVFGNITYNIVTVKDINPSSDNLILHEVYVRR